MAILMHHFSGDHLHFVLLLSYAAPIQERSATLHLITEGLQQSRCLCGLGLKLQCLCFNLMIWGICLGRFVVLSMGIILAILGPDQKVAVV